MPSNNEYGRRQFFKHVEPGDPVSASEWNKLTRETSRQSADPSKHPKAYVRAIKLCRLTENIGQFGDGYSSEAHRRDGSILYYDPVLDDFTETSGPETKTNIVDGNGLIYDRDEKIWLMYSDQSGLWHPINPRSIRHAITVSEVDSLGGSFYPVCPNANVFPIKFVRITYTKFAGVQTWTPVNMGGDGSADDHVLNIFEPWSEDQTYWIPEGTVIVCYNLFGYWYTYTCCYTCPESSSSSDSSLSSQSELSSQSSSSLSSQSVSQTSASSDSSSGGSSASSSFSSSSASSSVSVSDSSGYTCAQFVTSLSFDENTCELTYNVGCLCWPDGLGITYSDGACT